MREVENTEKNLDNPSVNEVKEDPKQVEEKKEKLGSSLDSMSIKDGTTKKEGTLTENKEKKTDDVKVSDVNSKATQQDKKETFSSNLDNLSTTGKTSEKLEKENPEKVEGVKEITQKYYDDARNLAQKSEVGSCFTDHTEDHVEQVKDKSLETAGALEDAIKKGNFQEKSDDPDHINFVGDVDKETLAGAALSHDTGMRGDGYAVNYVKDENGLKRFERDENGNVKVGTVDNENFDQVRTNHSLNSAINVLADREKYKELGYTDDQVDMMAAECMAHSKSSSCVHNLNSKKDWSDCFDCIDAAKEKYNQDHPDNKISFNRENLEKDDTKMGQLATSTLALRVGDVSRDSGPEAKSQSGDKIYVNRETINDAGGTIKNEIENADITRGELHKEVDSEKSKQVHAGEQNITENHTVCKEDGTVVHQIRVNDGTSAPACTAEAISDHVGEFASGKSGEFTIEVTFDKPCVTDQEKQAYEDLRDKIESKNMNNVTIVYPWDEEG